MKKLLALFAVAGLCVALNGCGKKETPPEEKKESVQEKAPDASATSVPTAPVTVPEETR